MTPEQDDQERLKRQAAETAVAEVEPDMLLGLGTGSTVRHVVDLLGLKVKAGDLPGLRCVSTSRATAAQAAALGVPLLGTEDLPDLDLCIDGADEVAPNLDLIKGLGGALVREKLVAARARRFLVVADAGKLVSGLGRRAPLPVAVLPFAWRTHLPFLRELGAEVAVRLGADGLPALSDDGLLHLDCRFAAGIDDPEVLETQLKLRPGIVESGLFLGMATEAIVAGAGGVQVLRHP